MNANSIPPDQEERWVDLLIAVIEAAHRDTNKANLPEPMRQEAHEFLEWAKETIAEDSTPRFLTG
jgi:hypothetical protein